jgi:hypothetical protein
VRITSGFGGGEFTKTLRGLGSDHIEQTHDYLCVKKKFNFVEMSDRELLEDDSFNANSKQPSKSTEEVTNADLFPLLKTYMNDKLSGTRQQFSTLLLTCLRFVLICSSS